jgi:hypothetical protein
VAFLFCGSLKRRFPGGSFQWFPVKHSANLRNGF